MNTHKTDEKKEKEREKENKQTKQKKNDSITFDWWHSNSIDRWLCRSIHRNILFLSTSSSTTLSNLLIWLKISCHQSMQVP